MVNSFLFVIALYVASTNGVDVPAYVWLITWTLLLAQAIAITIKAAQENK